MGTESRSHCAWRMPPAIRTEEPLRLEDIPDIPGRNRPQQPPAKVTWAVRQQQLSKRLGMRLRWAVQDLYSAGLVVILTLWNFEALFALCNCVGATCLYIWTDVEGFGLVSHLSWKFVSIMIVFPLTYEIASSFGRREQGLRLLANICANTSSLAIAHLIWDWPKQKQPNRPGRKGRSKMPPGHDTETIKHISDLTGAVCEYLKFPLVTRARNFFTEEGAAELAMFEPEIQSSLQRIYSKLGCLMNACELLKAKGMATVQISRMNQWHQFIIRDVEKLRNLREYRTPQGTRSLARVFIQLTPWLYGPYFLWIAHGGSTAADKLTKVDGHIQGYCYAFIMMTVVVLSMVALYNVQRALQDPFDEDGLDDIRISKIQQQLALNFKTCQNVATQIEADGSVAETPRSTRGKESYSGNWFEARRSATATAVSRKPMPILQL